MRVGIVFLVCAACSFDKGLAGSGGNDIDSGVDGELIDAPEEPFATGPFGTPALVSISSAARDDDISLTADMLEIYFESDREVAMQSDVYVAKRASLTAPWSMPTKVVELSSPAAEGSIEISADGRTIYFASNRSPSTSMDVYMATRPDRNAMWSPPQLVSTISDASNDEYDAQAWKDTVLYLGRATPVANGYGDVYRSTRASADATWSTPQPVPGLATAMYEGEMFADRTGAIWFTGDLYNDDDIYRAEPNGDGTYMTPTIVMEICGRFAENDAWVSPDGHTIFFTSTRNGSLDIFMATR
jgi:hypothetical protein